MGKRPYPLRGTGEAVRTGAGVEKIYHYTMLRRLCQRGIFENRDGVVYTLLSREEVQSRQSQAFLQENFQGSIPRFLLAAFSSRSPLTEEEIRELEQLIRQSGEGREQP